MSSQRQDEPPRLKRPDEIDEVFGRGNPNPDRIGCPPHDVLVALARRERPIGDPAYDHLSECSPCYLEVRALKEAADLQRRRVLTWAAAAAGLVLATGSAGWLLLNRGTSGEPIATEVRTAGSPAVRSHARRNAAGRSTSSRSAAGSRAADPAPPYGLRAGHARLRSGTRARQ